MDSQDFAPTVAEHGGWIATFSVAAGAWLLKLLFGSALNRHLKGIDTLSEKVDAGFKRNEQDFGNVYEKLAELGSQVARMQGRFDERDRHSAKSDHET